MSQIRTFSGIMIDPIRPQPELLKIEDIAHALSMLCRANGHFKEFHSVAQHCISCAKEANARGYSRKVQLACLLHDGSEAYLSDVTRPVKQEMPLYKQIEEPLQNMIWEKWLDAPLTKEEYDLVFLVDDNMLYHEFYTMTGMALWDNAPTLSSTPGYEFPGFQQVEQEYLSLFSQLTQDR